MIAGWRKNPRKDIVATPAGDRSTVVNARTQDDLQTGPAPGRITRILSGNYTGYTGPRQQPFFPATQDAAWVVHLRPPKLTNPAVKYRTYGDGASVPAVYAGNPIR